MIYLVIMILFFFAVIKLTLVSHSIITGKYTKKRIGETSRVKKRGEGVSIKYYIRGMILLFGMSVMLVFVSGFESVI